MLFACKSFLRDFEWFVCFSWYYWRSLSGQLAGGGFGESGWLIHMCGLWQRCRARWIQLRLSARAHTCCLFSMVVAGRKTSYTAAQDSKRKSHDIIDTHLHPTLLVGESQIFPNQIRGGEHRCHLLMKSRSKNLRFCFKTAKGMESIGGQKHIYQSIKLAHSMYFRS